MNLIKDQKCLRTDLKTPLKSQLNFIVWLIHAGDKHMFSFCTVCSSAYLYSKKQWYKIKEIGWLIIFFS